MTSSTPFNKDEAWSNLKKVAAHVADMCYNMAYKKLYMENEVRMYHERGQAIIQACKNTLARMPVIFLTVCAFLATRSIDITNNEAIPLKVRYYATEQKYKTHIYHAHNMAADALMFFKDSYTTFIDGKIDISSIWNVNIDTVGLDDILTYLYSQINDTYGVLRLPKSIAAKYGIEPHRVLNPVIGCDGDLWGLIVYESIMPAQYFDVAGGSLSDVALRIIGTIFDYYKSFVAPIPQVHGFEKYLAMISTCVRNKLPIEPSDGAYESLPLSLLTDISNFPFLNEDSTLESDLESNCAEDETLEELLAQVDSLVGLAAVKKSVHSLANLLIMQKKRGDIGLDTVPITLHCIFTGNPGTGKTTVARLLAKIYHAMGFLSKGQLVEVDRAGLVAGYVGQTALKVKEVVAKALGGVLFIDEAYALTANRNDSDYGAEAIDALLKEMEDHRDNLIVIAAGYAGPMNEFLQSNPGLKSRFNRFINFDNYNVEELVRIFELFCSKNSYTIDHDALFLVKSWFQRQLSAAPANFANGRDVRNLFENIVVAQANRLAYDDASDNQLVTLVKSDVLNGIRMIIQP